MHRLRFSLLGFVVALGVLASGLSPLWAQPSSGSNPQPPTLSPSESDGTASPTASPVPRRGAITRDAVAPAGVTITLNAPQGVTNYWANTYVGISGSQTVGEGADYAGGSVHFATHAGVTINDPDIRDVYLPGSSGNFGGYHNCPRLPAPNQIYYFKAFGKNQAGAVIATSNEVSIDMTDHAPSTVTLSAQVGDYWSGGQKVNLSWTATTDPDSNYEATYTLCEADHPGVTLSDETTLSGPTPSYAYYYGYPAPDRSFEHYAEGAPDPGKKHYYRLFVRDANNTVASNEVEVSVLQKAPDVEVIGSPRACAGGLQDYVHEFSLEIHVTRDNWNAYNEPLELSFTGNVGNPNKAKFLFYDENWNMVTSETQEVTTDWYGDAYITVVSSDTVSTPTQNIKWKGAAVNSLKINDQEVDSIACDFGKAQGKRRYGIITFGQGADDDEGFDFDPGLFDGPGSLVPGTYVLNWQQDPTVTADDKYFTIPAPDSNDPPVAVASIDPPNDNSDQPDVLPGSQKREHLDDEWNWTSVPNHKVEVKIAEIVPHEDTTLSSSNPTDYAYFVDAQGYVLDAQGNHALDSNSQPFTDPSAVPDFQLPTAITLTSDYEGKVHFFLRASRYIDEAATVGLDATDKTQHDAAPAVP